MLPGCVLHVSAEQDCILAHASCDFLCSFTYPCDVRVPHKLTRISQSSRETDLILEKVCGIYAWARTVMV